MEGTAWGGRTISETRWPDLYTALVIPIEETCHGLEELVYNIFASSGMLPNTADESAFASLKNIISSVRRQYNENKYHTFKHAAHVLVNVAKILSDLVDQRPNFSRVEGLALLFAALTHDIGHLGVSNTTLSLENHYLALLYNDQSVAEMHSLACAFQLLRIAENDILNGYSSEERSSFREIVIDLVLSTDVMDSERQMQQQLKFDSSSRNGRMIDMDIPTNRKSLFRLIIKSADVGAQMQNATTSRIWCHRFFLEQKDASNAGRTPQADDREFYLQHGKFMERHAAVLAAALASTGNLSAALSNDIIEGTRKNLVTWNAEGPEIIENWCSKSVSNRVRDTASVSCV